MHHTASGRSGGFAQSCGRCWSFDRGCSDPCWWHQQGSCGPVSCVSVHDLRSIGALASAGQRQNSSMEQSCMAEGSSGSSSQNFRLDLSERCSGLADSSKEDHDSWARHGSIPRSFFVIFFAHEKNLPLLRPNLPLSHGRTCPCAHSPIPVLASEGIIPIPAPRGMAPGGMAPLSFKITGAM